jgi:hypothetical protein
MKPNKENLKAGWLCGTENEKKGVADIFLMSSFLKFCKNMRYWEIGLEWRIFLNYAQCYDENRQTETIKNEIDKCV